MRGTTGSFRVPLSMNQECPCGHPVEVFSDDISVDASPGFLSLNLPYFAMSQLVCSHRGGCESFVLRPASTGSSGSGVDAFTIYGNLWEVIYIFSPLYMIPKVLLHLSVLGG